MTRFLLATISIVFAANLAEAACGWYLMVPPRSPYDKKAEFLQAFKTLVDTPLSKWHQAGSFDSSEACEMTKDSRTRVEHSVYSKASAEYIRLVGIKGTSEPELAMQRYLTEQNNANVDGLMAARCIASDDPRLR